MWTFKVRQLFSKTQLDKNSKRIVNNQMLSRMSVTKISQLTVLLSISSKAHALTITGSMLIPLALILLFHLQSC